MDLALAMLCGGGAAFADPTVDQVSGTTAEPKLFAALIQKAAQRFGIPTMWIRAVMLAEMLEPSRQRVPSA